MTVNTTDITDGPYTGNGATTAFAYNFRIEADTQIEVFLTPVGGVATLQVLTTDYTVDGISNDSGGDVNFVTPPALNEIVFTRANYPETQLTNFSSQGAFLPEIHEAAFDQLTFLLQQVNDIADRALRLNDNYSGSADPTLPEPVANLFFKWNAAATAIIMSSSSADLTAPGPIGSVTPDTIEGTTIQANTHVKTDTIIEKTAAAGVTIDSVLLKDGLVDGLDAATVEDNATADQTDAEIKTAYENNADTNEFSDTEQTKLSGIETNADVTDEVNVRAAIEGTSFQSATIADADELLFKDVDDSDELKITTFLDMKNLIGGPVLLQTIVASAQAAVELGKGGQMDGTYSRYLVEWDYVEPVDDNSGLRVFLSDDLGVSYFGGTSYHWGYTNQDGAGFTSSKSTGAAYGDTGAITGNGAAEYGSCGHIEIFNPALAKFTYMKAQGMSMNGIGEPHFNESAIILIDTAAIDTIKFTISSGNIAEGTFRLLGIP